MAATGGIRLRWSLVAALVVADVVSAGLRWTLRADPATAADAHLSIVRAMVPFLAAAVVGALVLGSQPRNAVGRVLLALGSCFAWLAAVESYALYGLLRGSGWLPGAVAAGWLAHWAWIPLFVLVGALLLLFPDGRPPGRRWRWVLMLLVAGAAMLLVSFPFLPGPLDEALPGVANPVAAPVAWEPAVRVVSVAGFVLLLCGMVLSAVSMVFRWRRGSPVTRRQITWVALAASLVGATTAAHQTLGTSPALSPYTSLLGDASFVALFAAIGGAILRYHLYDVDLVVDRTLVYLCLAMFVTATYVGIVIGVGGVIDRRTSASQPSLVLSVLATAVAGVAFAPVRERAQALAARLVYGQRQAPYDVLVDFGQRLAAAVSPDELLPGIARSAAAGVGAQAAEVRLVLADGSERRASWPVGAATGSGTAHAVPVEHRGEVMGGITVVPRPGVVFAPSQCALIDQLADQAAPALSNVRLTDELAVQLARVSAQAADLTASRQRLVSAQDQERRRLERDIHDGAQQQLVAITLQLQAAAKHAPPDVARRLDDIRGSVTDTLVTLRNLARGIFPPLLAEAGVVAALKAYMAKAAPAARLDSHVPPGLRTAQEKEAAVYFCCLEALQNVAKHAGPTATATVQLTVDAGRLCFDITDDGPGFDLTGTRHGTGLQGMSDRLAAVGGRLVLESTPGVGTHIGGSVPL